MRRVVTRLIVVLLWITHGAVRADDQTVVNLPAPTVSGAVSVEQALAERRSVRRFEPRPIMLAHLSQLLWAAQGVTDPRGFRTAPSAGGLYPLTIYVVVGAVSVLDPGLYRYRPHDHALARLGETDLRSDLVKVTFGQAWIATAPAVLAISGRESVTREKYGRRAPSFVAIEVGHAAQNVYLQAYALGLGTTAVGAVDQKQARGALDMSDDEEVLLLLPVGVPAD